MLNMFNITKVARHSFLNFPALVPGARRLLYSKYHYQIISRVKAIQNNCRYFHCTSQICVKLYMEYENNHAYSIMEEKGYTINFKSLQEKSTTTKEEFEQFLKTDWNLKTPNELFDAFSKLGNYCSEHNLCISDKMFDTFIDNLTDNIKHASDEQLLKLFYSLNKWPETESIRTRNFIEVWVALDDECVNRMKNWTFDEMLSYVALFYMLNVTRRSEFSIKVINKLATRSNQLTPGQLIQAFFYVSIIRRSPFDMHNLELTLLDKFSNFTLEEIAIMSLGFFKSKTPIRSMELVSKIIDLVIENSKTINEVSLAALLKVIRYSMKITIDDHIYRLLDALQHESPRVSVMCNVHIALLGTATLTLHKECLDNIASKLINKMSEMRLKDLERLTLTYGTFNLKPDTKECFFSKVLEELRKPEREEEILKHGRSFACCITYLGLLGIYPVDLISKALSPEFLEVTFGKQCYAYTSSILALHNSAEIFCPGEKMNRLCKKSAEVLAKKYTTYVPNEDFKKQFNIAERMMLDMMRHLRVKRGGDEFVTADHILTHHQRGDIIICNDHKGTPVPVKDVFRQEDFGLIRRPPNDNNWIILVVAGRNAMVKNHGTPTGPFFTKVRELNALGYHGILVHWSVYHNLETTEEKINYLNNLIKQAVNTKCINIQ